MDDDDGLAHHCDRTYGAKSLFVLEPVLVFQNSWWWKVIDVAEERKAFWARWKRQFL